MSKRKAPINFRPAPQDQERLEKLQTLKANISQIVKEALTPYLDQNFERLLAKQRAELEQLLRS